MKQILPAILLLISFQSLAQLPYNLVDGRDHKYCSSCRTTIQQMPPEVLFGIHINPDGDIYFSMTDPQWFNKIFKNNSYGVTVDIVSKDRYACGRQLPGEPALPKGSMLKPVYRPELLNGIDEMNPGIVYVKLGKVPAALKGKEIEGNLVIVNGNYICYYTNFVNIDRTVWQLLPMGLFTDSLLQVNYNNNESDSGRQRSLFPYTKKMQLLVPFEKASASFSNSYLQHFFDSASLDKYRIRQAEVRAYTSVEGQQAANTSLVKRRAEAIELALKQYQPTLPVKTYTAENWLQFYNDIATTEYSSLQESSKTIIRQKLTNKELLGKLEPMLSQHRKAVITLYLDSKTAEAKLQDSSLVSGFSSAVASADTSKSRIIQKEMVERILDNRLPVEYLNRMEVPQTKAFASLLNDREVYRYLLKATSEYEALSNLQALQKTDPQNAHIAYNICALKFFMWQYGGDTMQQRSLLKEIKVLHKLGIPRTLVKRMEVNYHILKCEENMRVFNYDGKDSSLQVIHDTYQELNLQDADIFSLAKYFSSYSRYDWAEEIITPRVDQLDVSEDLVFYYINLQFYNPSTFETEEFHKAMLNAINLNNGRFCNFFLPNDRGGAGMQLLGYDELKTMYCESCK